MVSAMSFAACEVPPVVWMPSVTSSNTGKAALDDTSPQPTSSPQEMQEPELPLFARAAMAALSDVASEERPLTTAVESETEQLAHPL